MMNEESSSSSCKSMEKHLPLISMIIAQFSYAGVSLLSKAAISSGMKPSIFVAYRQTLATIVLVPFAFFYHRKTDPPVSWFMLAKLFVVSSFGLSLSINLTYAAFNYVSATFVTASINTIPVFVFIIAVCLRIESLSITKSHGIVKVFGTLLCLSGAMAFTFYKGPPLMNSGHIMQESHNSPAKTTKEDWIKGALLLFASNFASSIWLVMQAPILKEYPATLRATTLQYGFSCLTSIIYAALMERNNISSWKIHGDIQLLSVAYSGIIATAITFTLQVWVTKKKGPVYAAMFGPLSLIVTAIFSTLFLDETLHWGSGVGAALLVGGLYSFLWGKNREALIKQGNSGPPNMVEAQPKPAITSKLPIDEEKAIHKVFPSYDQKK